MLLKMPPHGRRLRHSLPLVTALALAGLDGGARTAIAAPIDEAAPGVDAPGPTAGALPKVAVVILNKGLGKGFDNSVIRRIMEPLVPHTSLIQLPLVRRGVAKMGMPPQLLHLPKNLRRLGRNLGADFVLVVEAVGHGRTGAVFAGLVDVHTGETTVAKRVPMPTRALTSSQAISLVDVLVTAVTSQDNSAAAAPSDVAPAVDPGAGEAPLADAGSEAGADGQQGDPGLAEAPPAEAEAADANGLIGPRVGKVMVGLAMSKRVAHLIDTAKGAVTPPQYAGTTEKSNPFFPGFALEGEVWSGIATKHRRAWYDQFGFALNVVLAPVLSYTAGDATSKIKSTVTDLDALLQYRFLLAPKRVLTPDITLRAGISRFAFPLTGAQFPGVAYTAPHLGLQAHVPLHKFIAAQVHGSLRPLLTPGGEAGTELGKKSSGLGYELGGGVIGSYKMLEAGLRLRYQHMSVGYTGTTKLVGTPVKNGAAVQFSNIKLTDSLIGIHLTAGIAY